MPTNLHEIRIRLDKNAYRIIYFLHTGQKFVLLHVIKQEEYNKITDLVNLIKSNPDPRELKRALGWQDLQPNTGVHR